jgi:hypothetical protein
MGKSKSYQERVLSNKFSDFLVIRFDFSLTTNDQSSGFVRHLMNSRQKHFQDRGNYSFVCLTVVLHCYWKTLLMNTCNIKNSTVNLLQVLV